MSSTTEHGIASPEKVLSHGQNPELVDNKGDAELLGKAQLDLLDNCSEITFRSWLILW